MLHELDSDGEEKSAMDVKIPLVDSEQESS